MAQKLENKISLIDLINTWFYSDLDIDFKIVKGKRIAYCLFESDVCYHHTNNNQGVTVKTFRTKGKHRRFIIIETLFYYRPEDRLYEELKRYCYTDYTLEETISVINQLLDEGYKIR